MKEKWINDIRERMENYTPEVPEGLLGDIQEEMRIRGIAPVPAVRHRRLLIGTRMASAAAVLAALWLGADYYINLSKEDIALAQQIEQMAGEGTQEVIDGEKLKDESLLALNHSTVRKQKEQVSMLQTRESQSVVDETAPDETVDPTESVLTDPNPETDEVFPSTDSSEKKTSNRPFVEKNGIEKATYPEPSNAVTKKHRGISAGAFYSGGVIQQSQSGRGLMLTSANPYGNFRQEMSGDQVNGMLAETQDHEMSVHHDQPIKLGLSVNIPLSNRWSLQTGLTYSFLSSKITQQWDRSSIVSKRKMHFVGIPLRASYQFWEHQGWKVYAAAGGEVERMVSGREKDGQVIGGEIRSNLSRKLKESKLQFSGNAMAGIEYQWNRTLGVYAEAGAAYYFDNGSAIETIYSEKPLNVNLSLGFRFHFK